MNQLGFVVCFIFVMLLAISIPNGALGIKVSTGNGPPCKPINDKCKFKGGQCCTGVCEGKKGNKVCSCVAKNSRCEKDIQCCTGFRDNRRKCACPAEPRVDVINPCKSDNDCCVVGTTCQDLKNGVGSCK